MTDQTPIAEVLEGVSVEILPANAQGLPQDAVYVKLAEPGYQLTHFCAMPKQPDGRMASLLQRVLAATQPAPEAQAPIAHQPQQTVPDERAAFEAWKGTQPDWAPEFEQHRAWVEALVFDAFRFARASLATQSASAGAGMVLVQSPITEEMHVAACKVVHRAPGLDGLPQRMLDAMLAAAPSPAKPYSKEHS